MNETTYILQSGYLVLAALIPVAYLVFGRRAVSSPTWYYLLGSALFLFPGAVTNRNFLYEGSDRAKIAALLLVCLSVVCFRLGEQCVHQPGVAPDERQFSCARFPVALIAVVFAVGIIGRVFFEPRSIFAYQMQRPDRTSSIGLNYASLLAFLLPVLASLVRVLWKGLRPRGAGAKALVIATVGFGLLTFSRMQLFYILGVPLLSWFRMDKNRRLHHPKRRLEMLAVGMVILGLSVGIGAVVKGLAQQLWWVFYEGKEVTQESVLEETNSYLGTAGATGSYEVLLFILDSYPSRFNYDIGLSAAVAVTNPLPRSIFPWKPTAPSILVTDALLGDNTHDRTGMSLSTSVIGELWMNGGWLAVGVGSFAFGLACRKLVAWASRIRDVNVRDALSAFALLIAAFLPRGDINTAFVISCVYWALAYSICRIGVRFGRGRRVQPLHLAGRASWEATGSALAHMKSRRSEYGL